MRLSAPLDVAFRTRWKRGPGADASGPLLISVTTFTPQALRDLPQIYAAAERLREEACRDLDGTVGIVIYWQPFRRRVGSVSAWTEEAALRRFVALPYHREIMRRYRDRGIVRATTWQADAIDPRAALRRGLDAIASPLSARDGRRLRRSIPQATSMRASAECRRRRAR